MHGGQRLGPAHLARVGETVVLGLLLLGLLLLGPLLLGLVPAPASAAAGSPGPEPSPPSPSAPAASASPRPDPAPQAAQPSHSLGASTQIPPSIGASVTVTRAPSGAAAVPATPSSATQLPSSRAVATYRAHVEEGFALLHDADLGRRVPTVFVPRGESLLTLFLGNLEHLVNHKHQLFTYLKMMGVDVTSQDLYHFRG